MSPRLLLAPVALVACVGRGAPSPEHEPPPGNAGEADSPASPELRAGGANSPANPEPGAGDTAPATAPETAGVKPRKIKNHGDGRCEPMPRAGEPCAEGDGFCVLSWGDPGGWSSALWCRGGRWEIENERNLD